MLIDPQMLSIAGLALMIAVLGLLAFADADDRLVRAWAVGLGAIGLIASLVGVSWALNPPTRW